MALGKGLNSLIPHTIKRAHTLSHKETGTDERHDRMWHIPISEIVPNREQPRKHFAHDELEDLVQSIKQHGILQPLTVTEHADGGYELIAGERRLRAAQIAGLVAVPALVRSVTDQEKLELALIENIQRQNLNPIEEAFAYQRLMDEFGLTQEDVAAQVGKSRPAIANTVRLLDLPEQIQKALIGGVITTGKAIALLSLKSEKDQLDVFKSIIGIQASVRDTERAVAQKGAISRKGSVRKDPNVRSQEMLLEEHLGTKVRITRRGERGTIMIEYNSSDEFQRLMKDLT